MVPLLSLKARFPCIITHLNFRSKTGVNYPERGISEIVLGTDRPWEGEIMRELNLSRWWKSCEFFHFFLICGRYHKPCYRKFTHHEDRGENVNIRIWWSTNLSHVFSPLSGCQERMSLHILYTQNQIPVAEAQIDLTRSASKRRQLQWKQEHQRDRFSI